MNLTTKTDAPTTIRTLIQQWAAAQHRADTATLTDDLERAAFALTPETPAEVAALSIMSFEHDYLDQGERPPLSTDAGRFLSMADKLLAVSD